MARDLPFETWVQSAVHRQQKEICQQVSSKKQEVRAFLFYLNNPIPINFTIKCQ